MYVKLGGRGGSLCPQVKATPPVPVSLQAMVVVPLSFAPQVSVMVVGRYPT